jgi:hypothetical protein
MQPATQTTPLPRSMQPTYDRREQPVQIPASQSGLALHEASSRPAQGTRAAGHPYTGHAAASLGPRHAVNVSAPLQSAQYPGWQSLRVLHEVSSSMAHTGGAG